MRRGSSVRSATGSDGKGSAYSNQEQEEKKVCSRSELQDCLLPGHRV